MMETKAQWPKISIVTVNLNQEAFLEQTMLSIINQQYPNLEYIVIDGGSTDGSNAIIKKHEKHLAYWVSEKDEGLYHAINKGFAHATGDILMWLNSDDLLHSGALMNVGEIFKTFPQVDWITGINISFDEKARVIGADRAKGFTQYDFYTNDYQWLQQESTAWRRSLWEKSGGKLTTNYRFAADFELWIRFFRHAHLYPCDVLIGGFRMRSANQISLNSLDSYENEVAQIIKSEKKLLPSSTKQRLTFLTIINTVRSILRATYIFDLKILTRILDRLERDLRKKPTARIQVNRLNCKFELVK